MQRTLLPALLALGSVSVPAQTLVKDINTVPGINPSAAFSTGNQIAIGGGVTLFTASDGIAGSELWRTDGTTAGTFLLKDIYTGVNSATPSGYIKIGSTIYFSAFDGATTGRELWKTDGTAAGTVLVKDIQVGTGSALASTFGVALGTNVLFAANDGTNGIELWISDGTSAGTVLVKDINAAAATSSSPTNFAVLSPTQVLFSANEGTALTGTELWTTDGTTAGTVLLKDIFAGTSSSAPGNLTVLGSNVIFTAGTGATAPGTGTELWISDGTNAGTQILLDINPGTASSSPSLLRLMGGKVYFSASNGTVAPGVGTELWVTDGTVAGTTLVRDIYTGVSSSAPTAMVVAGSRLYFTALTATEGREIWTSDGTNAGTTLVRDLSAGATGSTISNLTAFGANALFGFNDTVNGTELWQSDGTSAGTNLLKDINATTAGASSSPSVFYVDGATAYFAATDGVVGTELWKTDGTTAGTALLKDIALPQPQASSPASFVSLNGKLYFVANDGVNGAELWVSDGTAAGTQMVLNINATANTGAAIAYLTVAYGKLWFQATDGVNGAELWVSDGTAAGTTLLDLVAGATGSTPTNMTAFGGKVYFSATTAAAGRELWVSDGTLAGSAQVIDLFPGTGSSLISSTVFQPIVALGAKLILTATDGVVGTELFASDGTAAGTSLLLDVNAGATSGVGTGTSANVVLGTKMFFNGIDVTNGQELWVTDGTTAGTVLVKDIYPGATGSLPFPLAAYNGKVYMSCTDGVTGDELYASDGTLAGTGMVKEIAAGTANSFPSRFAVAGDRLFFQAADPTVGTGTGGELYMTDGTTAGTILVKDILPGIGSGMVGTSIYPLGQGRRVLFVATDGPTGQEVWVSDGTSAGTTLLNDNYAGASSGCSTGAAFAFVGGLGFVSSNDGSTGAELYAFTPQQLGVSEVELFGASCQGTGTPTIGTSGGAPAVGNAGFQVTLATAAPSTVCSLFLNNARADLPIGPCTIYPSLVPTINVNTNTDGTGAASLNLPIPPDVGNIGVQLYFQWIVIDIGGPVLGVASTSQGLRIRVGGS